MAYRPCLICGSPSVSGRSRCSSHGRPTPRGPRSHDARQNTFRKAVLRNFKPGDPCGKCGLPIWDPPDAGHIVALSQGGTYDPSNGQPEHRSCNRGDGARLARDRDVRFFPDT